MKLKHYNTPSPSEIIAKLKNAGFSMRNRKVKSSSDLKSEEYSTLPLYERVETILGIINEPQRKKTNMLFFVMYDIESNKVRRLVAKYLLRQGCFRIQDSIFLADLAPEMYQSIRNDLAEVQAAYENEDSILVVPISTDYLKSMKIIGKNINVDIITGTQNTLFF